ncbi:L,D-transpeptidase [Aquamicrobium sp. LC103]|uniref:L,D-transpeptidase n=1 Tax=Aquamicrobium sp. LC103 TaxID=1120658 RepID=UPI00063E7EF2|nr:L,D-transpeptidase [Aquamicrobium sp. LC103]TKT78427.1 L,D-transpeptidase [Aquamicrobium sp. LC103]
MSKILNRRGVLLGLAGLPLAAGCSQVMNLGDTLNLDYTTTGAIRPSISVDPNITDPEKMYAAISEGPYSLPAVPYQKVPAKYRRQIVPDRTGEAPGTIVVDTKEHLLYLTQPGGDAIRYGVGIGKAGFEWSGRAGIQYKKKWPVWTPPAEMIARRPELVKYTNGQEGGPTNPLGARALYIFKDGQDTLYRVHGSPEWWSIGQSMSSGCVRLINQDIIDLYERVPAGAPIVVI